jgi:signal peptidase
MTILNRIAFAFPVLGVGVLWFLLLGPSFVGGPASYVVVAGDSMQPTLSSGDLVVLRHQDTYHEGDIVAFRLPKGELAEGAIVIHRVAGGTAQEGFITQGDNKERPDPWHPTKDDILGKKWLQLPGVGRFLVLLRAPLPLATLAGGLGMLTVLSGGSGKHPRGSKASRPRPAGAARGGPPGTGLIFGLLVVGAAAGALGLLRKKDGGMAG